MRRRERARQWRENLLDRDVMAKWPPNGRRYPGRISAVRGDEFGDTMLRIVWDDGDRPRWVNFNDIRFV